MKNNPNIHHPFKSDFLSRHHCYPKSRVNSGTLPKGVNTHLTIKIWREKHDYWRLLFKDASIDDIIHRLCFDVSIRYNIYYRKIFKCDPFDAVKILKRIKRIKNR